MTTPGTPLHCFACEQFSAATTNELQCSRCGSEAVEIIDHASSAESSDVRDTPSSTPAEETSSSPTQVPGFQGMFQNILSSLLPGMTVTNVEPPAETSATLPPTQQSSQSAQQNQDHEHYANTSSHTQAGPTAQPVPPPLQDFFTQIFGSLQAPVGPYQPPLQAQQNTTTAAPSERIGEPPAIQPQPNTRHFQTVHHGPGGSSVSFSFHTSTTTGPPTSHFVSHNTDGANHLHNPFVQHFPNAQVPVAAAWTVDANGQPVFSVPQGMQNTPLNNMMPGLTQFIAQALGHVPGTHLGDYASGEAFDNIMSELMNRNPQSNVRPASHTAISQLNRITLQKGDAKIGEECSICQDEYQPEDRLIELKCLHHYHDECLTSWLSTNGVCPICRAAVVEQSAVVEQDELD